MTEDHINLIIHSSVPKTLLLEKVEAPTNADKNAQRLPWPLRKTESTHEYKTKHIPNNNILVNLRFTKTRRRQFR